MVPTERFRAEWQTDGVADLERFVAAQDGVYERALAEIEAGDKRTHWMWFIFPQIAGLGSSPAARFYAISGRAEAAAYAKHPVLGPRLLACTNAVLRHEANFFPYLNREVAWSMLRRTVTFEPVAAA